LSYSRRFRSTCVEGALLCPNSFTSSTVFTHADLGLARCGTLPRPDACAHLCWTLVPMGVRWYGAQVGFASHGSVGPGLAQYYALVPRLLPFTAMAATTRSAARTSRNELTHD
ncbi:hypothetical protein ACQKDV_05975, partial [Stenotrophomonas sp. NPDC077659]